MLEASSVSFNVSGGRKRPLMTMYTTDVVFVVSDRKLPQIGRMREWLSRGIGVHHGGLLPIVKEVKQFRHSNWGHADIAITQGCRDSLCSGSCKNFICHGDVRNGMLKLLGWHVLLYVFLRKTRA